MMHYIVGIEIGLEVQTPSFRDALEQFRKWGAEYPNAVIEWFQITAHGHVQYINCHNSPI